MAHELDNIDRGILHLLQVDARNTTAQEMADKVGTSASTVRNRIERLEEDGVVTGYHPEIDYEAANLPLRVLFVVTAPPTERSEFVEKLLDVRGVIDVRDSIHEMGLEIEQSEMMKRRRTQPFDHFHYEGDLGDGTDESEE